MRWPRRADSVGERCITLLEAMRADLVTHREQLQAHSEAMNILLLDIQLRLRRLERRAGGEEP